MGWHFAVELPGFSGDPVCAAYEPLRIARDSVRLGDCGGGFDCRRYRCSRRPRRQFTDEFKQQAVRLVLDEGRSVTVVARELDLTRTALQNWVERARADRSGGKTGLTTAERDELARLRKENRILQEEREILKNVWSAPPLQGLRSSDGEAVCVNVSGLLVEPTAPGLDGIRAHRSS